MKSFKQYIIESEAHTPYPWKLQKHGGWWHPSGNHSTWRWSIDGGSHHVSKIVRSPELFGLNHDDIHNIITSNDPLNIKWRKHYGWNDEDLKKKLTGGIIDQYFPIEAAAYDRGWVGVRRTGNLSLMGKDHGLKSALSVASLHIPPEKLDTEKIHLYDSGKNQHFDLTGINQIDRYIKHG